VDILQIESRMHRGRKSRSRKTVLYGPSEIHDQSQVTEQVNPIHWLAHFEASEVCKVTEDETRSC
jgi:hypothetical protein